MPKYIFLDNWVLDQYTRDDKVSALSEFIVKNDFVILLTSLLLTELYNPGWEKANPMTQERGQRVVEFLVKYPCVIVDQQQLLWAEANCYPQTLEEIPIELDLNEMNAVHRKDNLLKFLRRDKLFLDQGKDIKQWAENYEKIKSGWLNDIETIKNSALAAGILHVNDKSRFVRLKSSKLKFLHRLDSRLLTTSDDVVLSDHDATKLVTGNFPAIQMTSLCFWYMYIAIDQSDKLSPKPSDIGDFYQMCMIPYCHTFTIDGTMLRLFNKIRNDVNYPCEVLNQSRLNLKLGL